MSEIKYSNLEELSKLELIKIVEEQHKKLSSLEKENELWQQLQLKNKQVKGLLTDIDKTEKKYKDVLYNFPLPILISQKSGKVTFSNKKSEKFVGYTLKEIESIDRMFELIYPDLVTREYVRRKWRNQIEEYERDAIPIIHLTNTITLKNKKERHVSFYAVEFQNDLLIVMVDLTDKKKIEDKLIQAREKADKANKAKTKFFANMTHEIKTPMNAILGFSQILEQTLYEDKDKYYVNAIKTAGNNLLKLIDDLLDFARLDSDNLPLSYGKTYLAAIINEMKEMFSLKLREKNLSFHIECDSNLPDVFILDEARIKQIIFNLINNSIQMTNKGHVKISLQGQLKEKHHADLKIIIKDSGTGMTDQNLEAIFNPFSGDNKALGLGLSKRLIDKMKGKLDVKSQLGKGTVFTIELNNIQYTNEVRGKVDFIGGAIEFNNETVLVVDDTQLNIEVVTDLLREEKLKLLTAKSGMEAIEIFTENKVDLIFLDLKMPGMSGYETLDKIREKKREVKIVALTASSESGAQILTHGFDAIIKKPFVRKELIDQLSKQLYGANRFLHMIDVEAEQDLKLTDELLLSKEEIVFFLENELESAWASAIEYEDVDEIKDFANRVYNYADKINFMALAEYASDLKMNLKTFNIKGIRKNLNYFGTFIENFKRSK